MGSPLSPILVDMILDDLKTQYLKLVNPQPRVFYRYVDDIFAIVPKTAVTYILSIFNNYHPRLQFTLKTENNNAINFLDTTVIRNGMGVITNWYRKSTFSGRYVNYFSNHPISYKINVVTNLVDRAVILSDKRFHVENLNIVRDILSNNCYPAYFIKYINNRLKEI